jgi:hypothetical protein
MLVVHSLLNRLNKQTQKSNSSSLHHSCSFGGGYIYLVPSLASIQLVIKADAPSNLYTHIILSSTVNDTQYIEQEIEDGTTSYLFMHKLCLMAGWLYYCLLHLVKLV